MTVANILAIDPGAGGGMAWLDEEGTAHAESMPDGMTEQVDFLRGLACDLLGAIAVIERVGGYMPGNSGPASVKFARHCGHLEAACYAVGLPVKYVAPQTWMKALGALPKDKKERKRAIKEAMARLYPHLTVTLKTADALGILTWARKEAGE